MHTVHVRVTDAATGKPTPVRLRFLDSRGVYHAPFGRLTDFAIESGADVGGNVRLESEQFAYIDGSCEIRLPTGEPLLVEVHKGPEYVPLRQAITLGKGQIALRLTVERWTDLRAAGWYSGDSRAHELSPHAALLEGAAEDLAVVNLLARERPATAERPAATINLLAFSGGKAAVEMPGCLVAVNTLNVHPVLGSVALLNCHRVVYPLRLDTSSFADWSLADWCDQCHRKSGLVVWAGLPRSTPEHASGEALATLAGKVDAFEICRLDSPETAALSDWYQLLNTGWRLPLVGGSGKESNAIALGCTRTYAQLTPGADFSYPAWIEAIRAGRTFVTTGPMLSLTLEGLGPGAVFAATAGASVHVRAEARGIRPLERLELLANGVVIAEKAPSRDPRQALLELRLTLSESGWIAARCGSQERSSGHAHTSPIYLYGDDKLIQAN